MNIDNFEETVQRVEGILVMGAKAIYDPMYGALGPGIQEAMTRQKCDLMMVS